MGIGLLIGIMLVWLALVPGLSWIEAGAGVLVGGIAFLLFVPMLRDIKPVRKHGFVGFWSALQRAGLAVFLIFFFLLELMFAAFRLAAIILGRNVCPISNVYIYPVSLQSPLAITLFSSLITLTPGTLAIDYVPGQKTLYVHCLQRREDENPLRVVRRLENLIGKVMD